MPLPEPGFYTIEVITIYYRTIIRSSVGFLDTEDPLPLNELIARRQEISQITRVVNKGKTDGVAHNDPELNRLQRYLGLRDTDSTTSRIEIEIEKQLNTLQENPSTPEKSKKLEDLAYYDKIYNGNKNKEALLKLAREIPDLQLVDRICTGGPQMQMPTIAPKDVTQTIEMIDLERTLVSFRAFIDCVKDPRVAKKLVEQYNIFRSKCAGHNETKVFFFLGGGK